MQKVTQSAAVNVALNRKVQGATQATNQAVRLAA